MKKDKLLHLTLKYLAIFCNAFFVWPMLVWVGAALRGGFGPLDALRLGGSLILLVVLLLLIVALLEKTGLAAKKRKLAAGICRASGTALSLALALLFFRRSFPEFLFNFLGLMALMFIISHLVGREYKALVSKRWFILSSAACILPYIWTVTVNGIVQTRFYNQIFSYLEIQKQSLWFNYIYISAGYTLFVLAYIFLVNQSNIDRTMERRHYKLAWLPEKVRLYNFYYLLILFSVVILAFVFKSSIYAGIMAGVGLILKGAFYLVFGGLTIIQKKDINMGNPVLSPGVRPPIIQNPLGGPDDPSNHLEIVYFIIIAIVLLFFGRTLLDMLRRLFKGFAEAFGRVFKVNLGDVFKRRAHLTSNDYVDSAESVDAQNRRRKAAVPRRQLKRKLLQLKDLAPAEKVKGAYVIYLTVLANLGFDRKIADTPEEIAGQAGKLLKNSAPADTLTVAYEQVKYGEQTVGEDLCAKIIESVILMTKQTRPAKVKP